MASRLLDGLLPSIGFSPGRGRLPRVTFMVLLAVLSNTARGQYLTENLLDGTTPPGLEAGSAAGSFALSGFDNVNLFDGKLNFTLPLLRVGGRGEAGYAIPVVIEHHWTVETVWNTCHKNGPGCDDYSLNALNSMQDETVLASFEPGYGPGLMTTRIGVSTTVSSDGSCSNPSSGQSVVQEKKLTRFIFERPDGSSIEFRDELTDGAVAVNTLLNCSNPLAKIVVGSTTYDDRGRVFKASDGSGATLVTDTVVSEGIFAHGESSVGESSTSLGIEGNLWFRNGTLYRIENGKVQWIRDRNGNLIEFEFNGNGDVSKITDSLKRDIDICYATESCPEDTGTPGSLPNTDRIVYKGYNGLVRVIRIEFDILENVLGTGSKSTYETLFPQAELEGIQTPRNDDFNPNGVVKSVQLPNNKKYEFLYTPYRELHSVTLPTGGVIEYQYGTGPDTTNSGIYVFSSNPRMIYRPVTKRIQKDGGTTIGTTTFSHSNETGNGCIAAPVTNEPCIRAEVNHYSGSDMGGMLLAHEKHFFYRNAKESVLQGPFQYPSWQSAKEFKSTVAANSGSTPLRETEHSWEQAGTVAWWTGDAKDSPAKNPRQKWTKNTVNGSLTSAEYLVYGSFNNVTERYEYDYGQFNPNSLPGTYTRVTKTDYETSAAYVNPNPYPPGTAGAHLLSLPTFNQTCTGSGCSGSNVKAKTEVFYDEGSLSSATGIIGHDTSSGSPVPAASRADDGRGNVTRQRRWISGSTWAQTSATYDIPGNVRSVTDAENNTTTASYSDSFEGPSSPGPTFGFRTSVTNDIGQTASTKYDYNLGAPREFTDINGVDSEFQYNNSLDRPTKIIAQQGTSAEVTTNFTYNDQTPNPSVTTKSGQFSSNDQRLVAQVRYDGFGRQIRTHQEEDNSDCIATIQSYDGLGRVAKVTNPIRENNCAPGNLTPTGDITTTTYDALGRTVNVKHPDNAQIVTSYSADKTTITDEAGQDRRLTHDGLGRLKEVEEDPFGSLDYSTTYQYDVLDNLMQVNQGSQQRTFAYDGLSRLTSANNIEQSGSTSFVYDKNGNLTSKTDPRSVTTTITYDDLNRAEQRSYSDGTAAVDFCYDGQLYSGGTCFGSQVTGKKGRLTAVGSTVSLTRFNSFDAAGRATDSDQRTDSVTYDFGYTYNRDGTLKSQTYPEGRTVEYDYDKAGRLKEIDEQSGTLYADAFAYAPHGGLTNMDMGNGYRQQGDFNNRLQPTWMWLECTAQVSAGCPGGPPKDIWKIELSYGAANNGNLLFQTLYITDPNGDVHENGLRQQYVYDGVNRLSSANEFPLTPPFTPLWSRTYGYDRYGNRWISGGTNPSLHVGTPTSQSHVSASTNRLASARADYDNAGNLTRSKVTGYQWTATYDAENKQTQYCPSTQTTCASVAATAKTTYHYDGQGNRVKKVVNGGGETVYVYDAFGKLASEYSNLGQLGPKGRLYRTTDHLGSTRIVTDGSGNIALRRDYFPFGEEIPASSTYGNRNDFASYNQPTAFNQQFTAKERDAESKLDYFLARYYSGPMGRFLSVDPGNAGALPRDPQSWNGYAYVLNRPIVGTDPDGRAVNLVTAIGGGIGGFVVGAGVEAFKQHRSGEGFNTQKLLAQGGKSAAVGLVGGLTGGLSVLGQGLALGATNTVAGGVAREFDGDPSTEATNGLAIAGDFGGGFVGGAAGGAAGQFLKRQTEGAKTALQVETAQANKTIMEAIITTDAPKVAAGQAARTVADHKSAIIDFIVKRGTSTASGAGKAAGTKAGEEVFNLVAGKKQEEE